MGNFLKRDELGMSEFVTEMACKVLCETLFHKLPFLRDELDGLVSRV